MKAQLVSIDRITVPDFVERPLSKISDDRDRQSIQRSGIQQPLVVIEDGGSLLLAKGLRRLRIARSLGIAKVPALIQKVPAGYDAETYIRELRLCLDMHRQDLFPSQKCALVEELKKRFGMKNKQVAAYLGIDADSVTNWLAVRGYIPPVVEALDTGRLTMQAARVFDGMTERGQEHVWKRHAEELATTPGGRLHKELRKRYDPTDHPTFYRNAEMVTKRLKRASQKRQTAARPALTSNEKRRLSTSLEMREIELREGQADMKRFQAEINAAIAPISGILRSEKLSAMLPEETRDELLRFAEVYC